MNLQIHVPVLRPQCLRDFLNSVNGGWSDFGDWSDCSVDCGDGERTRERECNNPAPKNGGAMCEGDAVQIEKCSEDPCPGEFPSTWAHCTPNNT